jgi:hypothetical protein
LLPASALPLARSPLKKPPTLLRRLTLLRKPQRTPLLTRLPLLKAPRTPLLTLLRLLRTPLLRLLTPLLRPLTPLLLRLKRRSNFFSLPSELKEGPSSERVAAFSFALQPGA